MQHLPVRPRLSDEAIAALKAGDTRALIEFHRRTFGGWRMELEDGAGEGGADGDAGGTGDQDGDSGDAGDDKGADKLGDAGKQALDRMKQQRNAARDEAREYKALGLSPAEIKTLLDKGAGDDGDKPDAAALQREADKKATVKANGRIVRSEVKAAATGKLADPADAYKFLDLSKFEVDDDGNVDEEEIAEAIDDLVQKKPYLAVQDGKKFKGSADGGPRKEVVKSVDEQIAEAQKAGNIQLVIALKQKRAAAAKASS